MRSVLRYPARAALAGALAIASSAILYRASDVSPETGAFFRCAYAVPVLWVLVRLEERRLGTRPRQLRLTAWVAGAFFAADLLLGITRSRPSAPASRPSWETPRSSSSV